MSAPISSPTDDSVENPTVDSELIEDLRTRVDDMETKLNTASENGLFQHQTTVAHKEILDKITEALRLSLETAASPAKYARAIEALDVAQNLYDTAIQEVGLRKRLAYVYGIPALIYMVSLLGMIMWIALKPPSLLSSAPAFLSIPKKILLAGAVGSILRGIWSLWTKVDEMHYRKFWGTWYLLSPFMGALLGGVVYLAFFVGIVTSTLSTTIANPALAILVAILAGFNWEWAQGVLSKAVEIFSIGADDEKA